MSEPLFPDLPVARAKPANSDSPAGVSDMAARANENMAALGDLHAAKADAAGIVANHQPRDRHYDDSEQKIVQGRQWLISFADLFSIILCFFVLVYSMREPDFEKISRMKGGRGSTGMHAGDGKEAGANGDQAGAGINQVAYGEGLNLDYLQGILKNTVAQAKLNDDVVIRQDGGHLNLVAAQANVFAGAALAPAGVAIVNGLADRLNLLSNRVTIAVIADRKGEWGVALAHAQAFATAMRESGYRKPLTVIAQGDGANTGLEIRVEADDGRIH